MSARCDHWIWSAGSNLDIFNIMMTLTTRMILGAPCKAQISLRRNLYGLNDWSATQALVFIVTTAAQRCHEHTMNTLRGSTAYPSQERLAFERPENDESKFDCC
jgi:hypothetical protein